jgi:hypothetical protein
MGLSSCLVVGVRQICHGYFGIAVNPLSIFDITFAAFGAYGDMFFDSTGSDTQAGGNSFVGHALDFAHQEYTPPLARQFGDGVKVEGDFLLGGIFVFKQVGGAGAVF